jgi:hypothetical protein
MMMEMTMATMGLRIKKFATAYFPFASLAGLFGGIGLVSPAIVSCGFSGFAFTCTPGRIR